MGGGDEEDVDEVEGDEGEWALDIDFSNDDDGEEGSESEEEVAGVADEA